MASRLGTGMDGRTSCRERGGGWLGCSNHDGFASNGRRFLGRQLWESVCCGGWIGRGKGGKFTSEGGSGRLCRSSPGIGLLVGCGNGVGRLFNGLFGNGERNIMLLLSFFFLCILRQFPIHYNNSCDR